MGTTKHDLFIDYMGPEQPITMTEVPVKLEPHVVSHSGGLRGLPQQASFYVDTLFKVRPITTLDLRGRDSSVHMSWRLAPAVSLGGKTGATVLRRQLAAANAPCRSLPPRGRPEACSP